MLAKATRAAASAQALLSLGDADGACNRAYYAMFDAARAALMAHGRPARSEGAKTHSGVISSFSLELVKTGLIPVELGRALKRAEETRVVADYRGDTVGAEDAAAVVGQALTFVVAMKQFCEPKGA
ncbi:MAG TPA: HEPN domain-containing protein [Burkholderiaceae bacterium]|nr:HEPN domain-containing protein [Burkholderiaceae bacterium]